jgi:hypothetical protein
MFLNNSTTGWDRMGGKSCAALQVPSPRLVWGECGPYDDLIYVWYTHMEVDHLRKKKVEKKTSMFYIYIPIFSIHGTKSISYTLSHI